MTHVYPDGSTLEIAHGDTYPPGHVGQHSNSYVPYVRMDGGPWHRLADGSRSTANARLYMLAAHTAAEAFVLVAEPAGE